MTKPRTAVAGALSALALGFGGSAAGVTESSWPEFRFGPAHTGATPYEHLISRANVARLRVAWTVKTGGEVWSSAAVSDGIVYIGSNDRRVYALRLSDGSRVWTAAVGGRPSAPAVVSGSLYVVADNATAYAFSAASGRTLWQANLLGFEGGFPAAPTVAGGTVFAMDEEASALDAGTGVLRWHRPINCFGCPVAFAHELVYAAGAGPDGDISALSALNPNDGSTRWTTRLRGTAAATPSIANGRVYVAGYGNAPTMRPWSLAAYDATTGRLRWHSAIGRSRFVPFTAPAVAHGRIIFPSPSGRLLALDARNGHRLWSVPFRTTNSAPAIANGLVYIGSPNGSLYAFDLSTGRRLWRTGRGGAIESSPTVAGGTVIVGSDDGTVRAYRLK